MATRSEGWQSRRQFTAATLAGTAFGSAHAARVRTADELSDALRYVDPELRPALLKLLPELRKESYTPRTLAAMRKLSDTYSAPPLAQPSFYRWMVPGASGQPDVPIYIVNSQPLRALRGVILHMHGGGYVVGRAADSLATVQRIAGALDCVAVAVEYRLAPEAPFPKSREDNYAVLRWLYANASALGVDRARIGVMGQSAGGGHAAALAIAARDRGEVPVRFQALVYPMLDDRTGSVMQPPPWIGEFVWRRDANRFGWSSLLGIPAGSLRAPAGAIPARCEDLSQLPSTFIGVGSIDLFVDEDVTFAKRLLDAGVPTELLVVPGAYHGFDELAPDAECSKRFTAALLLALRKALSPDPDAGSKSQ